MQLTKEQQAMLDGACGKGKALAMGVLAGMAKCFDAERLIPIEKAHISMTAQEGDTWFAQKLLSAGASCAVAPTVNPGYSLEYFGSRLTQESIANMQRCQTAYKGLGARMTMCCTPYLEDNIPAYLERCAISETNATIYVNAVLGAYTNRESAASALCAAVCGCTPEYGMLLPENRKATVAVRVDARMEKDFDYSVLGLMGKTIGRGIPVFYGLPEKISTEALIGLGTELNVSGNFDSFHIPGVTAEMREQGEAALLNIQREVIITQADLDRTLEEFSPSKNFEPDYGIFGCPHYNETQLDELEALFGGVPSKKPVYVCTSGRILQRARESGREARLKALGIDLIADTCFDEPLAWDFLKPLFGITDSPKGAYYMEVSGIRSLIRDTASCVKALQKGRYEA